MQALLANGTTGFEHDATVEALFTEGDIGWYTSFVRGDAAVVVSDGVASFYEWDPTSGAAPDGVTVVMPLWSHIDEAGNYIEYEGDGRWIRTETPGIEFSSEGLEFIRFVPRNAPIDPLEGTTYYDIDDDCLLVAVDPDN